MSAKTRYEILGDIAEIIMGQSPPGDTCSNINVGLPLLNGPTEFGSNHPLPTQFTTSPSKIAEVGDLLFCVRGSTGRMNWADQKYAIGRGIGALRHLQGNEYQPYLRGVIEYKLPDLLARATGSIFSNVSRDQLSNLEIPNHSLPVQKKIAAILSSLDDKIELNTRMNNVLEEIARALFHRWFVEFEFPDAEGKPYKSAGGKMVESEMGSVPEGWDIVSFRDIITVRTEKSNDPDIPEYSVTNLGIYPRDEKYKKKLSAVTSKNKIVHQFDLVFGMSREILNWGLMKDEIGGVSSAYNVFIIDQTVNPLFLESFMKNNLPYFKDVIKPASREGQGVDKAALYSKNIYLPPKDVLDSYYKIEERLLSMCKYHDDENARLTEIRDSLLPKLMSGELNFTS